MISGREFPVEIDYDQPLAKAIALAELDYVNAAINEEHFPSELTGKLSVVIRLARFDVLMTEQNVLTELSEAALRPADIRAHVALSKRHPDLQRQFPIVGLGSVWSSNIDRVPVLWGGPKGRSLFLLWAEYYWLPGFRFAAIPN